MQEILECLLQHVCFLETVLCIQENLWYVGDFDLIADYVEILLIIFVI